MSHIAENLQRVEKRIEDACVRADRDRGEVTLIAVSKTKPVSDIAASRSLVRIRYRNSSRRRKKFLFRCIGI